MLIEFCQQLLPLESIAHIYLDRCQCAANLKADAGPLYRTHHTGKPAQGIALTVRFDFRPGDNSGWCLSLRFSGLAPTQNQCREEGVSQCCDIPVHLAARSFR